MGVLTGARPPVYPDLGQQRGNNLVKPMTWVEMKVSGTLQFMTRAMDTQVHLSVEVRAALP